MSEILTVYGGVIRAVLIGVGLLATIGAICYGAERWLTWVSKRYEESEES